MSAPRNRAAPLLGITVKPVIFMNIWKTIEAGISLTGPEVKSLRAGQVNFTDSYVEFRRGEKRG